MTSKPPACAESRQGAQTATDMAAMTKCVFSMKDDSGELSRCHDEKP